MTIEVRGYQADLISSTRALMANKHKRVILQSPCGSGKTRTSAAIVEGAVAKGRTVLFLVAGRSIVQQAYDAYTALGIECGILMAGNTYNHKAKVQIASVHTVYSRLAYLDWLNPDLIIVDEAHEAVSTSDKSMWSALRAKWPKAYEVGLTATPKPTDIYTAMTEGPSYEWLIGQGHLVRPRYYSVKESDSELLRVSGGEFTEASQAAAFEKLTLVGGVVEHYKRFANGRPTVLFGPDVATSRRNADMFNEAGISALHIDAETPQEVRQAAFRALADGSLLILCNYGVLGRAFDCPAVSCVIFERETKSLTTWIQAISRALRAHPDKTDAVILDLGENCYRFGDFVSDPVTWSLDGERNPQAEREEILEAKPRKDVTCSQCHLVYKAAAKCPGCGHEPVAKAKEGEIGDRRNVGLEEVKPKARKPAQPNPEKFYAMLRYAEQFRSYGNISADHVFREKFGSFPTGELKAVQPVYPSLEVSRWIRSRQIAFHARKPQQASAHD